MKQILLEDKRSQLLSRAKTGDEYAKWNQFRGKNRYQRRLYSRLASSVKNFNSIDMNKLFKDDILDVDIDVKGETDIYVVRVSFAGFLDELHNFLNNNGNVFDRKIVVKALTRAFNSGEVYFNCTCADFRYRHKYYATKNNLLVGAPEIRPSDITNPNDTKGPACKHVTLALSDSSWLIKVSSVIYNYVTYMEEHDPRLYEKYIYPAIYQKPYEPDDDTQLDIEDDDRDLDIRFSEYQELVDADIDEFGEITDTTKDILIDAGLQINKEGKVVPNTLDKANKWAREKNWFKKPNKTFTDEDDEVELEI